MIKKKVNQDIINNQELVISDIENKLCNWNMPKVSTQNIYKIDTFDFLQDYIIKTCEQNLSIQKTYDSIHLLSKNLVNEYKKHYNYLHIELVQVAAKPLHRLGIDTPILIVLRDKRAKTFKDSILTYLQSNLHNGPVYFNCFPDFTVVLNNPRIDNFLSLLVKTKEGI